MRHIRLRRDLNWPGCTQETLCGGTATVADVWPQDAIAAVDGQWRELCGRCVVQAEAVRLQRPGQTAAHQ